MSEAEVWARVSGSEGVGPAGGSLAALLGELRGAAAGYRALANRASGEARQILQAAWREKRRQARTLAALYRYLTGEAPPAGEGTNAGPLENLLRGEELAAGRLDALADRCTGEARQTLLELAADCRALFRRILPLLGQ